MVLQIEDRGRVRFLGINRTDALNVINNALFSAVRCAE